MLKLKLIKLNKTFKRLSRSFAERNLLFFLGLLLAVLFLGGIIFYYYLFSIEISDQTVKEEELLKLDREVQQRVLEEWRKRNENLQKTELKEYPDPFNIDQK